MNEQREAVIHTTVFYSYAHADESLREELEKHLSNLRRQGIITGWHDRQIIPGTNWAYTIDTHLNTASIILLLISADFLASEYCYCIEMQRALERHKNGEARVIPIILRPVDMEGTPFAHLQCLPRDAVPVTLWTNQDEAFRDIAIGIRTTIEHLHTPSSHQIPSPPTIFLPSKQEMLTFSSSSSIPKDTNRQRMLERVQTIWITGLLKQSLQGATPIALGLHKQPNLVENPWRLALQEIDEPTQLLPPDTCITQVYAHTNHELLILGEPGSGKTTLLLELARDLINRAFHDDTYPMPIIFNLSSWALKRLPLTQWLVEELNNKYQVPRKLAQSWIDDDKVLLLLDGLDEVDIACREACIQAINTYRQEHGLVPLVICSRSAEYLAQKTRVLIRSAVVVQPLTAQQIDDYLSSGGEQLEALRTALHEDLTLQELAATPLMLSTMTLAYHGKYVKVLLESSSPETRRRLVFEKY